MKKNEIGGIGFDGTCSLVVIGEEGKPLTVSPAGISFCYIRFI